MGQGSKWRPAERNWLVCHPEPPLLGEGGTAYAGRCPSARGLKDLRPQGGTWASAVLRVHGSRGHSRALLSPTPLAMSSFLSLQLFEVQFPSLASHSFSVSS